MTVCWLAELRENDTDEASPVLYRIGRDGDTRVAEWPGLAWLRCERNAPSLFRGEAGADPAVIAKVEAGLARALVRSLDGELTLHSSAVSVEGRGVAFLGNSGAGKSTLARAICEHDMILGARLLADDMTPIEFDQPSDERSSVTLLPSERSVWLWKSDDQIYKSKIDVPYSSHPAALSAVVTLMFTDGPIRLRPLKPAALFAALIPGLVRFALDDPEAHAREMAAVAKLCRTVRGFTLHRPRDLSGLGESVRALAPLFTMDAAGYPWFE